MSNTAPSPSTRRFRTITVATALLAASPMLVCSGYAVWRLIVMAPQGGDNAFLVPLSLFTAAAICFVLACAVAGGVFLVAYTARAIWQQRRMR